MTQFIPYRGDAPERAREQDAAFDLRSKQHRVIEPGNWMLIQTGFQMGLPPGYVGLVCSRSGLALKHGVFVLNAPGIVDPDYIGDVGVILQNLGAVPFTVNKGDRIAQLLIVETPDVALAMASAGLTSFMRQDNGFGSSGVA